MSKYEAINEKMRLKTFLYGDHPNNQQRIKLLMIKLEAFA